MARVGEGAVERPEAADEALGILGDGLGKVAALGRHGAYDGHAALRAGERVHKACALVEAGQAAGQVGGEALLRRHLFEAAGDLAQGLGPAGGGVRHERDVVAHVAVVFGYGHARVDGGLAGRDGHV